MSRKPKKRCACPACNGRGEVCCPTWALVRAHAGDDLEVNKLGLPLWPLLPSLEMSRCPFCGRVFEPKSGRK